MKKLQRGLSMLGKKSVLERSILKASWNDEYTPPKTKYIQACVTALNSKGSIDSFALLVQYIKQITPSRWVFSCKILYIAHISIASSDTCYDLSDYLLHDDGEFTKVKSALKAAAAIQLKDAQIVQYQTARLVNNYWKYIFIIAKYARSLYNHRYTNEGEEVECDDMIVIKDKSNNDNDNKLNDYDQQDLENSLKTAENILEIGEFLTKLLEQSISNLITLNMFEKYPFLKLITAACLSDLSLIYSHCKTFWQIHEKYFFKGVLLDGLFTFYEGLVKLTKRAKKIEFIRNHCRPCQILRLPIDYLQIVYEKNQKIELFYMQQKKGQERQGEDQEKRNNRNGQMEEKENNKGKEFKEKRKEEEVGQNDDKESIAEIGKDYEKEEEEEEGQKRQEHEDEEEEKQEIKPNEGNYKNDHNTEKDNKNDSIPQPTEKHQDTHNNAQEAICIVSLDSLDTQAKDKKNNNNHKNTRADDISTVGVSLKQISERHKYQRHFRQNSAASTKAQPASILEIPYQENEHSNKKQINEKNASNRALQNQNIQDKHLLQDYYQQPSRDTHPLQDNEYYETIPGSNNNSNIHKPIHAISTGSESSSQFGLSNHFQHSTLQPNDQNFSSSMQSIMNNPIVSSNPPLSLHNTTHHPFQISFKKKRTTGSQELDAMQQQNNNNDKDNQQDTQDKQSNEEQNQVMAQHQGRVKEKSIFNQRKSEYSNDPNDDPKHEPKQQYFVYSSSTISKLQRQEEDDKGEEDDDYSMVDLNTEENMSMCLNSESPTSVGNKLTSNNTLNGREDIIPPNNNFSAIAAKSLITAASVFQRAHSSVFTQQPNGNHHTNTHQIPDSFPESSSSSTQSNEYFSQAIRKKNKKTTFSKAFLTPQHKTIEQIPTASITNQQKSSINANNSVGMFYV